MAVRASTWQPRGERELLKQASDKIVIAKDERSGFTYVPQIDGLRALAVLSVIVYHLSQRLLPGGFSGVDVFFVISGYVVSASMAHQRATRLGTFILEFYAKRIRRIVPALVACLTLTSILAVLFIPQSWLSDNSRNTGALAFFGVSNLSLMQSGDDYFAPRAEFNPFTHTWSLGVEEQFYVAFPLVFFLWTRTRNRVDAWSQVGTLLLASLIVISLMLCWWLGTRNPTQAFYLMPSRFWELGAGALLFQFHDRGRLIIRGRVLSQIVLLAALVFIAAGFAGSSMQAFPLPWALCPVIGTLGAIACTARTSQKAGAIGLLLANPLVVWVGKISYSLYLWHWPIYVLFRWTVGLEDPRFQLLALLITVAMSAASYYAVERQFRFNVRLTRVPTGPFVTASVIVLVGLASVSFALFHFQPRLTLSVTGARSFWYVSDTAAAGAAPQECPTIRNRRELGWMGITEFLKPECAGAAARPKLHVVGDSHATAYTSLLRRLSDYRSVEVSLYKGPGCGFLQLIGSSSENQRCADFSARVVQEIAGHAKSGDIVFLPSLRLKRLADQWGGLPAAHAPPASMNIPLQTRQAALQEAEVLLEPWLSAGLHVVFEAPTPIFRASLFRCSDWFNRMNPACEPGFSMSRAYLQSYRQPVMESLATIQSRFPAVVIWDPFPILCPGETCFASDANGPLFFDSDHLSGHANAVLYEPFVSAMRPLGLFEAR